MGNGCLLSNWLIFARPRSAQSGRQQPRATGTHAPRHRRGRHGGVSPSCSGHGVAARTHACMDVLIYVCVTVVDRHVCVGALVCGW